MVRRSAARRLATSEHQPDDDAHSNDREGDDDRRTHLVQPVGDDADVAPEEICPEPPRALPGDGAERAPEEEARQAHLKGTSHDRMHLADAIDEAPDEHDAAPPACEERLDACEARGDGDA